MEVWKPVKGFEARFCISSHGRIMSIGGKYGGIKILNLYKDQSGYIAAQLNMKPFKRKVRVHTLVAEHFLEKPDVPRICVNHKDGNKTNNRVENLEWVTGKENIKHAVATGIFNIKGEMHPHAILERDDVIEMRRLYSTGKYTQKKLGEMFGVCRRQAGDVIRGVNWGWLV